MVDIKIDDHLEIGFCVADSSWYVFAFREGTKTKIDGPYETLEEVQESLRTSAYRIRQGWKP